MKRLSSVAVRQTITFLVFLAASVLTVYGQEVKPYYQPPAAQHGTLAWQPGTAPSKDVSNAQAGPQQTGTNNTAIQPFVFPTRRERFKRYVKSTVGPPSFAGSAVTAGIHQWQDHPEEWEQGASGYGRRYASDFARNAIQQTVVYGLDSALGLDTRFRRSTRTGFFPRMADALAENVTSRTRSGKRVISVPRITGVYAARIIQAEAWYPSRYNYKDGLRRGTRSLAVGFGLNLIREFIIRF